MSNARTRQLAERRVGRTLDGKWRLDSLLGFGGSAAVYGGTHRNGKRAAVKVLHPQCVADEQLRTRFLREGYVANKIGHSGAVSVLDDDTADDGTVYIVMELLEGTSLERRGRGELPPMTLPEVLRVADDLLDVLASAHAAGVVHRDIKPANLFVTTAGELKVLDFGIARLTEASVEGATQTGLMMGTPAFMPPEQARARWDLVDARSDLWAVGATMLALAMGRRPRMAETANEELLLAMTQPLPPAITLVPGLSPEIGAVIDCAVAFNRDNRYPDAPTMRQALRLAAGIAPEGRFEVSLQNASTSEMPLLQHTIVTGPQAPSGTPPPFMGPPTPRFHEWNGGSVPLPMPSNPASWGGQDWGPSHPTPEPESPSTASNAVSHSHAPMTASRGRSGTALGIVFAALAVLLVVGVGLLVRVRQASTANASAAAAAAAEPKTAMPLPAVTANVPAMPATTVPVVATEAPSASAAPSAAGTHRDAPKHATPSTSANPSKYFDSRF